MDNKVAQLKSYSQLYESFKYISNEGFSELKRRKEKYDVKLNLNYKILKKMLYKKKKNNNVLK